MKILLLEDDIALNKAIENVLKLDHHHVRAFMDGQDIIESIDQQYDLYILDINVPNVNGLELLDNILLMSDQAKVIMISSNTDIQSLQTAYDLGCMDYLKKPFYIAELRAKINRLKISRDHLISGVKLKTKADTLTKKEKRFLTLLLENESRVVTYEMIENYVYENKLMSMDALRALVRRLRAKLVDNIIQNAIDEGYMISEVPVSSDENIEKSVKQRIEVLENENSLLKLEKEILVRKSTTDPLTGLYNRVKIQEIFLYEQQQFILDSDALSVILLDLDDFKSVNDSYGHNVGDKYLQNLAKTLNEFFRPIDVVGRWGGEEFLVLLPRICVDEAKEIALKLKETINGMECPNIGQRTASFGVATLAKDDTLSSFVQRADEALLLAKSRGKNCVEVII